MSTIARHDGWRGSGCSLAGTTLALGESKTLKQRRCAACGGMHVDGERNSPKHGSNLAGKCPPPPQAAGHPTLRDGSTSNGTSARKTRCAVFGSLVTPVEHGRNLYATLGSVHKSCGNRRRAEVVVLHQNLRLRC